jgi:hypothetical protein
MFSYDDRLAGYRLAQTQTTCRRPHNDEQELLLLLSPTPRAHAQTRRVVVHRLFARDTVDESLRDLVGMKTIIFNDYAGESAIKDASPAAVDTSETVLMKRLVEMELRRHERALAS